MLKSQLIRTVTGLTKLGWTDGRLAASGVPDLEVTDVTSVKRLVPRKTPLLNGLLLLLQLTKYSVDLAVCSQDGIHVLATTVLRNLNIRRYRN